MAAPTLLTFRDMIDHGIDYVGGQPSAAGQRDIRAAVLMAYDELTQMRNWHCYWSEGRIITNAPQTEGTIEYDHTGGAFERLVTLTGSTWPSWADKGNLLIGDVIHRVATVESTTTLTLSVKLNPGADLAPLTNYTLFQDIYTLPPDFREMGMPINEEDTEAHYVTFDEWFSMRRVTNQTGDMRYWTVAHDPDLYGSYAAMFFPYPDSSETIDYAYQRLARPLVLTGYNATVEYPGGFSATAGTATVNGASTAFTSSMIGSVFRAGTNGATTPPTGIYGLSPYSEQKIIRSVTNANTLTVDSNFAQTYSAASYVISDPVDISGTMANAMIRNVEKHLAIKRQMKNLAAAVAAYEDALRQARGIDQPTFHPRSAYDRSGRRLRRRISDMPLGPDL